VDDRDLVAALRAGDVRGLAGVYDAYADRLYSYAVTMLRDRDAAADAVHDALLLARDRIGQLRDPEKLRPWLYAIVRSECLRRHRDSRRLAPLAAAGDVIDVGADDLGAGAREEEIRELVWSAADALNPGEREVLELTVRHGLDGAELADALNVSINAAHALASRARAQLERSLGALLVARTGTPACGELVELLGDWDGKLNPLLRKRVARHADKCAICGETRQHRLNPVALLAGAPLLVAPDALRERVLRDVSFQGPPGRTWRRDGFPAPVTEPRRRVVWSAAAVAVLAGLLTIGLLVRPDGPDPEPLSGESLSQGLGGAELTTPAATTGAPVPSPTSSPTSAPTATTPMPTSSTAVPTATTPAPTVAPTRPPATTRPPTAAPTTPKPTTPTRPPVTPTISISYEVLTPDCTSTYRARLTAVVTGGTATAVTASWTAGRVPGSTALSDSGGGTWSALVSLEGGVDHTWQATADLPTGTLTSGSGTMRHDCAVIG
jgi:RNA polymerase sigma factor (sigma-70 family)